MFGSVGTGELLLIFVVALLLFGPRKLPELGRSLGKSLAEFKKASNELRSTLEEEIRAEEHRVEPVKTAPISNAEASPGPSSGDQTVARPADEHRTA